MEPDIALGTYCYSSDDLSPHGASAVVELRLRHKLCQADHADNRMMQHSSRRGLAPHHIAYVCDVLAAVNGCCHTYTLQTTRTTFQHMKLLRLKGPDCTHFLLSYSRQACSLLCASRTPAVDTAHLAKAGSTLDYGRKRHLQHMLPVC